MNKHATIIFLGVTLFACQNNKTESENEAKIQELESKIERLSEVKLSYDNNVLFEKKKSTRIEQSISLSMKEEGSHCYINRIFEQKGVYYIEVDFYNHRYVEGSIEGKGYEAFEVVNNNPKIRTYILNKECYEKIDRPDTICIRTIGEIANSNPDLPIVIHAKNGIVQDLYISSAG